MATVQIARPLKPDSIRRAKAREYSRKYRLNHPDRVAEVAERYAERRRELRALYAEANADKIREYKRAHHAARAEEYNARRREQRAAERAIQGPRAPSGFVAIRESEREERLRHALELSSGAWLDAYRNNGHDLEELQPDTEPGTYVAQCWACDGYVVVDLDEEPQPYGRATLGPCPGTPPVAPAPRRDPMDSSVQEAGAHVEPVGISARSEVLPADKWNWSDQEFMA